MTVIPNPLWDRYRKYLCDCPELGISVDVSRVRFPEQFLANMAAQMSLAFDAMTSLEAGSLANVDESRMVGHYWLRAPELAPRAEIQRAVENTVSSVLAFVDKVHTASCGNDIPFRSVIHVGIGGSSLGAQFLCEATRTEEDTVTVHFLDNADPDSIDLLFKKLKNSLRETLISIVSKTGATPTPKYVQHELELRFEQHGLDLSRRAVATTVEGTDLDNLAVANTWLAKFPIWDWVGGRTSVTSAVGLLPAALQGVDIRLFLEGAAAMDRATRIRDFEQNPAALMALMWYWLGNGCGDKNVVVLPYKDSLQLFPRYVQQLMMESLGKKYDRSGVQVEQGFSVFGNKGSTDQHAYMQQLREGPNDFFAIFVGVREDKVTDANEVAPGLTLGDYLFSSLEGTRNALYELGRDSITILLPEVTPRSIGGLVALFERAVGLYAELINVNAYNQPGVDKFVAEQTAAIQQVILSDLAVSESPRTAEEIATDIGRPEQIETVYKLLERLASNRGGLVSACGESRFERQYWTKASHSQETDEVVYDGSNHE